MPARTAYAVTAACALGAMSLLGAPAAHADSSKAAPKVEIVLDASGSMAEPAADGHTKIDDARTALRRLVTGLPSDARTGMRVYGATQQGIKDTPKSCHDSQQVVPIGTGNKAELRAAIGRYKPKGQTPTAYALTQAAQDLGSSGQRSIILVSDGEATCHPDPCTTARKLARQGIDLHIDVVGLKVDDTARTQLQCVADAGNGTYFDADDTSSLVSALTVAQVAAHSPFDPQGSKVTGARSAARAPVLTAGSYVDAAPTDDDVPRFYRLHHTIPGSTMWVGITTQMAHGNFSTLLASVETADGRQCSSDYAVHDQLASVIVTTSHRNSDGCAPKHDQYLTLKGKPAESKKGQQVQITVVEEPPARGHHTGSEAKGSESPEWVAMKRPTTPKPLRAVPSLSAAPKVEPGTYGLELAPHSVALVKVHLGWGQRLQVIGRVPPMPGMGVAATAIDVDLLSPIGGSVTDKLAPSVPDSRVFASEAQSSRVPVTMRAVDYANRNSGLAWINGTARPGDYYVAVSRRGVIEDSAQAALPVHLQIAVVGQAGVGAPTYVKATATSDPRPTTSATNSSRPRTHTSTVVAARAPGSSGTNWPLIGGLAGGVVVLAAAGGVAAAAVRRRS